MFTKFENKLIIRGKIIRYRGDDYSVIESKTYLNKFGSILK